MKTLLKFLLVLVILTIETSPSKVEAERTWNACSGFDSSDSQTSYGYDLDYICASQYSERPNEISFFLFFKTIISANQFNNSYGSWAAMTIDTNYDGEYDLYVRTANATLLYDRRTVAGRAVRNGQTIGCPVEVWTDLGAGAKWLALSINKDCAAINGIGLNLMGYADSKYYTNSGYDWAPTSAFYVGPPGNAPTTTTTSTTTTTTTIPVPNAPSSVGVTALDGSSVRVNWLDNSSGEQGFLIQRNDLPVPAGTTVAAWPYKVGTNVTEWSVAGLTPGSQVCFAVSAFNASGASRFTDFACLNLVVVTTTTTKTVAGSLSCDAQWGKRSKTSVLFTISAGALNAGKRITVEAFDRGKWVRLGMTRVTANGEAAINLKGLAARLSGALPVRATQGSRFICEGTVR